MYLPACAIALFSPPIPTDVTPLSEQPVEYIEEVCGLYFRSIVLAKGQVVPQHVHPYNHATFIASGRARAWSGGNWKGDFEAGRAVEVTAGIEHVFQALEDNTRLSCIHDTRSAEFIKSTGD